MTIADQSPTFALISAEEAAMRLCVSKKTLLGFVQDGSIPKIPIGRGAKRKRCAFDPADIEAFARSRKQFEAPKCQSSKGKAKRSTATTSKSQVVDLREVRARLMAEKRKK
ncbi:AlpA family transcriptional regulator [Methylosinus sp. R-45379]|uniref:helix-turn-helix transcriptional regulator n=1 Tax=Methylosinus sp. R-45379 TaxID=980563 RepID=UPI000B3149C6|nr:helix-turn-helix domain-containing protein [Methylosinus sp. R-45379]